MFAEKHYPELLQPKELDTYLEKGWYRMGQSIFTTHFLCFGESIFSAIWIRLDIRSYSFRKSLKKIIKKNKKDFTTIVRKAIIDYKREELYQKYKRNFKGLLAPSLQDSLLDGEDSNLYNTYEVAVYDGNQLIAVSYFDLGYKSSASIMGIYDPDYQQYSLGIYTMLAEIEYSQSIKLNYYYPGYVVPGYERFDYKLRIGDVDYFDIKERKWKSFLALDQSDIPINKMQEKLNTLQLLLNKNHIRSEKLFYPLFEANLFGFWPTYFFDYPVFLLCHVLNKKKDYYIVVAYDIRDSSYQLLGCAPFEDIKFYFNESYTRSFDRSRFFLDLVVVERLFHYSEKPDGIVTSLLEMVSMGSRS
ncbi:MAG: arginine-tRNA-protein transferase [Bacteroidota bacterium]